MKASPYGLKYDAPKDRESAHEILMARADQAAEEAAEAERLAEDAEAREREFQAARRYSGKKVGRSTSRSGRGSTSIGGEIAKVVIKELKGTTGKRIVRGILGGLFKGR